jgi:hypothetical protein
MRVLANVHTVTGWIVGFEHVVEEDERSDTAALC